MNGKISRAWFYILSLSWGFPMTLIGALAALLLFITGHRAKRWDFCFYFEVGENWGGLSLGMFFFIEKGGNDRIKKHEHGHGVQNCYFGFLMPFAVFIPSVLRYWYRNLRYDKRGIMPKTAYDAVWFERSATRIGTELHLRLCEK